MANFNVENQVQNTKIQGFGFNVGTQRTDAKTDVQKSIFNTIDKNKDGVISQNEYDEYIQKLSGNNEKPSNSPTVTTDANGNKVTQNFDQNNNLTSETITAPDGTVTTKEYGPNGELAKTTENKEGQITITKFKDGQPDTAIIQKGITKESYDIDEQGNMTLMSETENEGIPGKEKRTLYQYLEDGSTVSITTNSDGTREKKVYSETDTETKIVTTNNSGTSEAFYDKETGEVIKINSNYKNGAIESFNKTEDGFFSDYVDKDNKVSTAQYDKNGNTYINVEKNENAESIANKFGVSVEELLEANGLKPGEESKIDWGTKIVIPKTLSAGDPLLTSRLSYGDFKVEIDEHNSNIKKTNQQNYNKFLQSMGVDTSKKSPQIGKNVTISVPDPSKGTHEVKVGWSSGSETTETRFNEYQDMNFKVIGQVKHGGNYVVQATSGKYKGQYFYAGSDLKNLSDPEMVKNKQIFGNAATKQIADQLYYIDESTSNQRKNNISNVHERHGRQLEYVLTGQKDAYGNDIAVDKFGRTLLVDRTDPDKTGLVDPNDSKTLAKLYTKNAVLQDDMTATPEILENLLDTAQTSLNAQIAKDGWVGKTVDLIGHWGNNNKKDVQADLNEYKKQINTLNKYAKNGKTKEFNAAFKNYFGVDYDAKAVATYAAAPNEETYKKAFGDKQNAIKRVNEYNWSQETGKAVAKGTAKAAVTIAAGATGAGIIVQGGMVLVGNTFIDATDLETSEAFNRLGDEEKREIYKAVLKENVTDAAFATATLGVGKAFSGAKTVASNTTNIAGQAVMSEEISIAGSFTSLIGNSLKINGKQVVNKHATRFIAKETDVATKSIINDHKLRNG